MINHVIPANSIATEDIIKAVIGRNVHDSRGFLVPSNQALATGCKISHGSSTIVAKIMAAEMNKDESWIKQQINDFTKLAKNYIPSSNITSQGLALTSNFKLIAYVSIS